MAAQPEPPSAGGRQRAGKSAARPAKLSRDGIVDGALTFLDREGWDSLTINALATQLGTKGPSLYNHVDSLEDLRRAVRMRVIDDIITMLNRVGEGRARDDAVLVMAGAYRSYAHHHPGRYSAFTRMPLGGDDPECGLAGFELAVIFRARQPEIQLKRIGCFGRLAERQQAKCGPKRRAESCFSGKRKDVTHIRSADVRTGEPCREASPRSSAARQHLPISQFLAGSCAFHGS